MENKKVLLRDVLKKFSGIKIVRLYCKGEFLGSIIPQEACKSSYYDSEVTDCTVQGQVEARYVGNSDAIEFVQKASRDELVVYLAGDIMVRGKSTLIEIADNIFEYMEEDRINPFVLWLIKENFKIDDEADLNKGVAYKFEKVPYSEYQKSEFFYHRQRGPELYHWRNKDYSKKEMEKIYDELKPYNIGITEYEV